MKRFLQFAIVAVAVGVGGVSIYVANRPADPPQKQSERAAPQKGSSAAGSDAQPLTICSFNIQFLGHFKKRDDPALASILKDFDIVVVQELVAPPTNGTYPNGEAYSADAESAEFFEAMAAHNFTFILSEEDTGTNDEIHKNGPATEWWVVFYRPNRVKVAADLHPRAKPA